MMHVCICFMYAYIHNLYIHAPIMNYMHTYALLLEHMIEAHGPPLCQPYRRQNPAVRREEMAQVQQMLASNVICPSNSPWASPVVMVRKKDGSLRLCRFSTIERNYRQRRSPIAQDRRPPRRSPWGSMVLHPRPQERVLAGAYH